MNDILLRYAYKYIISSSVKELYKKYKVLSYVQLVNTVLPSCIIVNLIIYISIKKFSPERSKIRWGDIRIVKYGSEIQNTKINIIDFSIQFTNINDRINKTKDKIELQKLHQEKDKLIKEESVQVKNIIYELSKKELLRNKIIICMGSYFINLSLCNLKKTDKLTYILVSNVSGILS